VRPTRARGSPILHSLFNAARNALVFTCDFLHCILRSRIVDLPGFHANFLSLEPPKIGIVSKPAHQLRPHPIEAYRRKPPNMRPGVAGTTQHARKSPAVVGRGQVRFAVLVSAQGLEIFRRGLAAIGDFLVLDGLTIIQTGQDVNEDVLAAVLRLDEPVSLL
jgi:hypothetical protein